MFITYSNMLYKLYKLYEDILNIRILSDNKNKNSI